MFSRATIVALVGFLALLAFAVSTEQKPKPIVVQPENLLVQPVPGPIPTPTTPTPAPQPVQVKVELLDLYSTYCRPCKEMEPTVKKAEARGIKVQRINVDQDPGAAEKWHIDGTPTYILLKNGVEVDRFGPCSEAVFMAKLGLGPVQSLLNKPVIIEQPLPPVPTDDVAPPIKAVVADNGWRLRVFYPPGRGQEILDLFVTNPEFAEFGHRYGYDAYATNDIRFEAWRKEGYPTDEITIVLVDPKDRVVFRANGATSPSALIASLEDAASRSPFRRAKANE
jgi:thioredoxin 1